MTQLETRERLLQIALELIWRNSYSSVGVNEICAQAGVTKGAFYHHFESKASLFCEATVYYWQVIKGDLEDVFSDDHTALERLENLISYLLIAKLGDDNKTHGCPFYNAGAQIGTHDEQVVLALQTMASTASQYNQKLVEALYQENYLERQEDSAQVARILYQYIHGVMNHTQLNNDIELARQDLPAGLYRLLGVKPEYWFSANAKWQQQN
jgi:TetR/AcrR family transcriptional repressor of nem operon